MMVSMYRQLPRYRHIAQLGEVLRIVSVAQEFGDQSLKVAAAATIKWICSFDEVVEDFQWQKFEKSNSELADELRLMLGNVKS